jgi:hypothetical protein
MSRKTAFDLGAHGLTGLTAGRRHSRAPLGIRQAWRARTASSSTINTCPLLGIPDLLWRAGPKPRDGAAG